MDEKGKRSASNLYKLESELTRVTNGYTRNLYNNLLEKFGFKLQKNGKYKLGDFNKLIEFIQDEMMKRKYPDDMVEGLNLILELKKAKKVGSFDILTNKGKIETLLFSIIGKNAIKQKVFGDGKTQVSSLGMGSEARIVRQETDDYHTLLGSSDYERLNFYKDSITGTIGMGVLAPHQFRGYFKEDMSIVKERTEHQDEETGEIIVTEEWVVLNSRGKQWLLNTQTLKWTIT